jgi:Na+/H+ antiporter NhaC
MGYFLSTFISAYLLAKLSPLLDKLGSMDTLVKGKNFEELATRAGFAFATFLVALIWTFLLRRYSEVVDTQEPQ